MLNGGDAKMVELAISDEVIERIIKIADGLPEYIKSTHNPVSTEEFMRRFHENNGNVLKEK